MSRARWALVAILVLSTAVFAAGAIAERSGGGERAEPAVVHREEGAEPAVGEEPAHAQAEAVLGVDVESTPLIGLAVVAGLGLAALAATRPARSPAVLLAIALVALAWAALDVREVVHQLDEAREGIAAAAAAAAVLHLAAAALAGMLAMRARHPRTGPAGTLPA